MTEIATLFAPMSDGDIYLEELAETHREGLRAACAADTEIWQIYPFDMSGDGFDPVFDAIMANPNRRPFALIVNGTVIGMSGYLNLALDRQALEIGGTFIAPAARGTGLNGRIKKLLLDRAFGCGIRRVEFRVDVRNMRSQAAVMKLGAVKEGVLRAERITWTGHVRDTAVFSILAEEWAARA
jgi:RimJ/RimL family protein N-acetyltransferase